MASSWRSSRPSRRSSSSRVARRAAGRRDRVTPSTRPWPSASPERVPAGTVAARRRGQFVQEYTPVLRHRTGERFVARAYAGRQPGRLWEAWLVFLSLRTGRAVATDRETTQSTREHVLYWATGLGRTYLQGALARALAQPGGPGTRRIAPT